MKLIVVDAKELKMGIQKEMEEHGMSYKEAHKTAIDHLKENPHYYSISEKAGLEEENLSEHVLKNGRIKGMHDKIKKIEKRTGKKVYWVASS